MKQVGESQAWERGFPNTSRRHFLATAVAGATLGPTMLSPSTDFFNHNFLLNPQARPCAAGVAPQNAGGAYSFISNRMKKSCRPHHAHASSAQDKPHPWTSTQLASA